ncbi:MAG: RelA/SpoT family protein [Bacteroidia bacterium]|nr:RelA/SpoT family protein [Bacteroidia bacterium]
MQSNVEKITDENAQILAYYRALLRSCRNITTSLERKEIGRAFRMSLEAHANYRRKSGEPYIYHPIAVARIVAQELGLDAVSVICALLHDVVEDTSIELSDIEREFGVTVAKIIDHLTKISGVFEKGTSEQVENYRRLLLTLSDDIRVILIKLADRLHNMRTLEHMKGEKQLKIASETRYIYAPLAHRLGLFSIKSELDDLALKFMEPETYRQIVRKLKENKEESDKYIKQFVNYLREHISDLDLKFKIKGRYKSINSIAEKIKKQAIPFEQVYDLFAVRIIIDCSVEQEIALCYHVYQRLISTFKHNPGRLRDWIAVPKSNGYRSLHVTVLGPKNRWVEVQIRSIHMDIEAERGVAAHWKYKDSSTKHKNAPNRNIPSYENWILSVREMLENQQLNSVEAVSNFQKTLVIDEIFAFTPKGDLIRLPVDSCIADFAYAIHSKLGSQCIGAKVNGKLATLTQGIKNGDHIEVLTSAKQSPKPDWLDAVKTPRAIHHIKRALSEVRKQQIERGRTIFLWKLKQFSLSENNPLVHALIRYMNLHDLDELLYKLGTHSIDVERIMSFISQKVRPVIKAPKNEDNGNKIVIGAQEIDRDMLLIDLNNTIDRYEFPACCHPLPGDDVVGLLSLEDNGHVEIHKTTCPQAIDFMAKYGSRIVKVNWNETSSVEFLAAVKLIGEDRIGMMNSILRIVSVKMKLNIRSIFIDAEKANFEGILRVYVQNSQELERMMANLMLIPGITEVMRMNAESYRKYFKRVYETTLTRRVRE